MDRLIRLDGLDRSVRCVRSVRKDRFNRRVALVALTYNWVEEIGNRVKPSIDDMISQLFKTLPKVLSVFKRQINLHLPIA